MSRTKAQATTMKKVSDIIMENYTKNFNTPLPLIKGEASRHMFYKLAVGDHNPNSLSTRPDEDTQSIYRIVPYSWNVDKDNGNFKEPIIGIGPTTKDASRNLYIKLLERLENFYSSLTQPEFELEGQKYVTSDYVKELKIGISNVKGATSELLKEARHLSRGGLRTKDTPITAGTPTSALLARSKIYSQPQAAASTQSNLSTAGSYVSLPSIEGNSNRFSSILFNGVSKAFSNMSLMKAKPNTTTAPASEGAAPVVTKSQRARVLPSTKRPQVDRPLSKPPVTQPVTSEASKISSETNNQQQPQKQTRPRRRVARAQRIPDSTSSSQNPKSDQSDQRVN